MERSNDLFDETPQSSFFQPNTPDASTATNSAASPKPDARTVWAAICESAQESLNEKAFAAWIKPLKVVGLYYSNEYYNDIGTRSGSLDAELLLAAPNKFSKDHVVDKYSSTIKNLLSEALGTENVSVTIKVDDAKGIVANPVAKKVTVQSKESLQDFAGTNLNPRSNFSNFVVGDCNQFAHAVSLQIAKDLGSSYNPLFVYGGVGLGKTHLANAIGNAALRRGKKVLLVSSETFVSELIASLRSNNMSSFKNRFRSLDLLIIDDIQFIIGKERTQEEFFHTFNELHQRHKQIVITSDKTPQELVGLEDRLRTRFASGIAVDLQAPDFETRVAILSKKAELLGTPIPEAVSRLIATKISSNVRELEGVLNKLLALSSIHNSKVDTELANKVLASFIPKSSRDITIDVIQQVVAKNFNVSINDITGKRRTANIALSRQVAMYLSRKLTPRSYPEIGAVFGGRDHSTVIHAKKVIEEKMSSSDFLNHLLEIEREITG